MRKITIDYIKKDFSKEGYKLLTKKYVNNNQKLIYICTNNHKHYISWRDWKSKGRRCPFCNIGKLGANIRLTYKFVNEQFEKEGYKLLSEKYKNAHQKLSYICKNNHKGNITWNDWKTGYRCRRCYYDRRIKPYEEASKSSLYSRYKCDAKRRNYKFELSKEEFLNLTSKNCYYCNSEPSNIEKSRSNNGDYIYNGIDRVDNDKDYTLDNCVPCCKICNRAKDVMSLKEFKEWVFRIYKNMLHQYKIGE